MKAMMMVSRKDAKEDAKTQRTPLITLASLASSFAPLRETLSYAG
jgi:hypothetical protein